MNPRNSGLSGGEAGEGWDPGFQYAKGSTEEPGEDSTPRGYYERQVVGSDVSEVAIEETEDEGA